MSAVLHLNESLNLQFAVSIGSYSLGESKSLEAREVRRRTLEQFVIEAEDPASCPSAKWQGSNFYFSFGFLTDGSLRYAIFEISEASLDRMNLDLEERGSNLIRYLCELFTILKARQMVMGPELDYSEAVEVLEGNSTAVDNSSIILSMGIPINRLPAHLVNHARRIECHGVPVLVEWFPGYPEL
jgi:hypothetical protein